MTVRYKINRAKRTKLSALSSLNVLHTRHRGIVVKGSHEWVPLKLGYIIHHVLSRKWRELRIRSTLSRLRHSSSFAELELSECVRRLDIDIDSDGLQRKGGPWGQGSGCLHTRRKNLLGDFQSFLVLGCFSDNLRLSFTEYLWYGFQIIQLIL